MLRMDIPGFGKINIRNLVLDYNGTLAADGQLLPGMADLIIAVAKIVDIHVVTADTYGSASHQLSGLPIRLDILEKGNELIGKRNIIEHLGSKETMAIGNGRNDELMLEEAIVGVSVIGSEGCASVLFQCSDICVRDVRDAFGLLLKEGRLKATLRF